MGRCQCAPAAKVGDPSLIEQIKHFGKGERAVVAGVVVGQRHCVEMTFEHWQCARVRAKGEGLVRLGRARGGHDTFEVADANVGCIENGRHGGERITSALDHFSWRIVEQNVADKSDGNDRFGIRRLRRRAITHTHTQAGEQAQRKYGLHDVFSSKAQPY